MLRAICLLYLLLTLFSVNAELKLLVNGNELVMQADQRLSQVLIKHDRPDIYWPASQIFRDNNQQSIRTNLLSTLPALVREDKLSEGIVQVIRDRVISFTLAERLDYEVDLSKSRFSLENDPLLNDGRFIINLRTRPNWLQIEGLAGIHGFTYSDEACIQEKLKSLIEPLKQRPDIVYTVSLTGDVRQLPVSYWNKECSSIAPGSTIYIPLHNPYNSDLIKRFNEAFINVLVNRVMPV